VTPKRSTFPTRASTLSSARSASARSPTRVAQSPSRGACSDQAGASSCWSTCAAPLLPTRLLETLLDPLAVRFAAEHLTREPLDYVSAEGFEIERLERSKLGIVERAKVRKIVAST